MWSTFALPAITLMAALTSQVAAQVVSDCNPMNGTDCPPNPAFGMDFNFNFNSTPDKNAWATHVGPVEYDSENGAAFTIKKQGDSPTIKSKFYFFGGRTEIIMKASPGAGIISSMMWVSDTLDEVDWEFVGSDPNHVQSNYFGKGKLVYTEGEEHLVPGAPVAEEFHNYTCDWTKERLEWWIDGNRVRVLERADALENGDSYPQTPMRLFLGIWAGGDPSLAEGTREWAGGDADYDAGPYTMYVKEAHVTDYSSGKEYAYGDDSGMWESIEIVDEGKNSTVKEALLSEPEKSIGEKFNDLPDGAKYGIYAGGAFVAVALLAALIIYFLRQRRRGQREAEAAAKRAEIERQENEDFEKSGVNPDGFSGTTGAEYNPANPKNIYYQEQYEVSPPPGASPANAGAYGALAGGAAGAAAGAGAYGAMRSASDQNAPAGYSSLASPTSPTSPRGAYGSMRSPSSPVQPGGYGQMRSPSSPAPPQNAYGGMRSPSSPAPSSRGYGSPAPPPSRGPQSFGDMNMGNGRF